MYTTTTILDKKAIYALNKKYIKVAVFSIATALICLTVAICLSVLKYDREFFVYGISAGLLFAGIVLLISVKKAEKQSVGKEIKYVFEENSFTVSEGENFSNLSYSIITSLKETNEYLFLYISKTQAYIVSKENLPQEFTQFIKDRL